MSLIGWWKLDSDAADSTLNGHDGVVNNVSWVDGKIGGAGGFDGSSSYISAPTISDYLHGRPEASIALWCKKNAVQYGFLQLSGYASTNGNLYPYDTETKVYLDIFRTDRLGPIYMPTSVLEWHHVAIVQKPGSWRLYQNGELVHEASANDSVATDYLQFEIGRNSDSRYANGLFDDVRVYDHALSLREIKELSKAKVAHWKFDDFQEPTINKSNIDISTWTTRNGLSVTETTEVRPPIKDAKVYLVQKLSDSTLLRDGGTNNNGPLSPDSAIDHAFSVYVRATPSTASTSFSMDIGDGASASTTLETEWKRVVAVGTGNATDGSRDFTDLNLSGVTGNEMYVACVQVEKKNYPTPWVADVRDGVIRDSSGYNFHIQVDNDTTPKWVSDANIGSGAYYLNGQTLVADNPLYNQPNLEQEWTCTAWFKLDNADPYIFLNNLNNGNRIIHSSNRPLLYLNSGTDDYYNYGSGSVININTWHHIAFVFKNEDLLKRIYVDGVDITIDTGPNSGVPSGLQSQITMGSGLEGYLAELRIYATALSADDISELYKQRASLDGGGNFYIHDTEESTHLFDEEIGTFNLVENGTQGYESNYNLTAFEYDAGINALRRTSGSSTIYQDNYIPIIGNGQDAWDQYRLEGEVKGEVEASRYYYMILCYDKYFRNIGNADVNAFTNTATTLAQDLVSGDEWVYLADTANWWDNGVASYDHRKGLALWHPDDDKSVYTPYKYTKRWQRIAEVDKVNNRLRFDGTYSGTTIPSGSPAQNHMSGSTYSYIAASNVLTDLDNWAFHSADTSTTPSVGNVRYGTSYIRVGFLINREATNPTTLVRNLRFYNLDRAQNIPSEFDKNSLSSTGTKETYNISEIGPGASFQAWYPLISDGVDKTSNSADATISGATPLSVDGRSGYSFDGAGDHLWAQHPFSPAHFTINFWLRLNAGQWGARFDVLSGTSASGWGRLLLYRLNATTLQFYVYTNAANTIDITGADVLLTDTWRMITLVSSDTMNESVMKTYVDGVEHSSGNLTTEYDYSNQDIYLMSNRGSNNFAAGYLSDIRIYNKVLSPEEIGILYDLTALDSGTMMKQTSNTIYLRGQLNEVSL